MVSCKRQGKRKRKGTKRKGETDFEVKVKGNERKTKIC